MEDNLKKNGRRLKKINDLKQKNNGRQPQKEMEDDLKKLNCKTTSKKNGRRSKKIKSFLYSTPI
jgi:hypothetical protein